ncbi:MAG TPA: oligosaccharide flippase family protein [Candidatus Tyrphobacter sp.]
MASGSAAARFSALLRADGMLRQSGLVFTGSMALSLGGFAFHAIASRKLGVEAYGTLYALLSLGSILALPGALLTPVISRFAAEFMALHDERHLRRLALDLARLCAIAAGAYVIVTLLLAFPAARYLDVPAWGLPIAGIIAGSAFASGTLRAIAQGAQTFGSYAFSTTIEGATKLIALIAFGFLGWGLLGGALGFFVGSACGLAAIAWRLIHRYARAQAQRIRYDWRRIVLSGAGAGAMIVATTCMGTVDVVLVKHFFAPGAAGFYAAAALGGKVLLYFVGFIPTVMLPRVTERHVRGEGTRGAFAEAVALLAALAAGGLAVVWLLGRPMLHALVGGAFDRALPLLVPYGSAMILLAATNLLASYGIATHRLRFTLPLLAGTFATLAAIVFVHPSLRSVAQTLLIGNAATFALVCSALAIQSLRRAGAQAP